MSRIGKKPINVPKGVDIKRKDNLFTVKGPKGTLTREFRKEISINIDGDVINVTRSCDEKMHRAFHGLTRSLLNNMIVGVTEGFEKKLDINGVGYRAQKQGKKLVLTLGYSHPVELEEPEGITIDVPAQNKIVVKGIDKQLVGEIASQIRGFRKPEPYKGKGIKYDFEVIKRKEGKTGAKK
jgi:large subunit ribosomal protein L6